MKIVCISDTHCQIDKITIPEGDILIHAGDHSYGGSVEEMAVAIEKLAEKGKKFKHIITICGNHDWLGEKSPSLMKTMCQYKNIVYLDHESTVVEGLVIFGSAYTPEFCSWAFNVPRGQELARKWNAIPDNADIVITHGPVHGILDTCPDGFKAGCEELFKKLAQVKPKLHVCGHIHDAYGMRLFNDTVFVNASICTEQYKPTNEPIVIELE
jgi:Icc-related predicted phosphoesterase